MAVPRCRTCGLAVHEGHRPGCPVDEEIRADQCELSMVHHLVLDSAEQRANAVRMGFDAQGHPPNCPAWRDPYAIPMNTQPVHTCGDGCRVIARSDGAIEHYGWPEHSEMAPPHLGCGLVCVPGMSCGGCPKGTPWDPVDAKSVDAAGLQQATDWHAGYAAGKASLDPDHAPQIRLADGCRSITFEEPLTAPILLVPEACWPADEPIVAEPAAPVETPGPRRPAATYGELDPLVRSGAVKVADPVPGTGNPPHVACTCDARPGQGHQLLCAIYR